MKPAHSYRVIREAQLDARMIKRLKAEDFAMPQEQSAFEFYLCLIFMLFVIFVLALHHILQAARIAS